MSSPTTQKPAFLNLMLSNYITHYLQSHFYLLTSNHFPSFPKDFSSWFTVTLIFGNFNTWVNDASHPLSVSQVLFSNDCVIHLTPTTPSQSPSQQTSHTPILWIMLSEYYLLSPPILPPYPLSFAPGKSCFFHYLSWPWCLHSSLSNYISGSIILIYFWDMPQLSCLFLISLHLFDKTTPVKSNPVST